MQGVPDPHDPHDPLAPRPDDPRVGGCCWRGRRTDGGRSMPFPVPLWMVLMTLVVGFVALGVVLLVRAGAGG